MREKLGELDGMELVKYCMKDMIVECYLDDSKWIEVVKSIQQIK